MCDALTIRLVGCVCLQEIEKLNRDFFIPMGSFQIPFNPKQEATSLLIDKCRYMSSKMVPLWLVFRNADVDAPPIYILFKSGDDLRQDILTLQMLRVMDKVCIVLPCCRVAVWLWCVLV
jgi:phosphatidylinositol kinase/protein kinase (PI-3  family)